MNLLYDPVGRGDRLNDVLENVEIYNLGCGKHFNLRKIKV